MGTPIYDELRSNIMTIQEGGPVDTVFADVSEFQNPVDGSYPYQVLSIRANDGTYKDHKFNQNYPWMRRYLDSGSLVCGIVYCYCRTNWDATAQTLIDQVNANGGLHPRAAIMLDVESGGNPGGNGSDWINRTYWKLADWAGDPRRIIGYANAGDFYGMWPDRPPGLQMVGAGYGVDPHLIGQLAHQYSDGKYGCGGPSTPCGVSPFGNCDMNSADGLDPFAFAARMGIGSAAPSPGGGTVSDQQQEIWDQLRTNWPQLGGQTLVDAVAQVRVQLLGPGADNNNEHAGTLGWPQLGGHTLVDALALVLQKDGAVKATVTDAHKTPSRSQEARQARADAEKAAPAKKAPAKKAAPKTDG